MFSLIFGFDPVLVWGVFDVFCGLRCVLVGFLLVIMVKKCKLWVFVRFSFVVKVNGSGLWVLEKIR